MLLMDSADLSHYSSSSPRLTARIAWVRTSASPRRRTAGEFSPSFILVLDVSTLLLPVLRFSILLSDSFLSGLVLSLSLSLCD